ncbi:MAG TPA: sigma-70 family RNA polymerase sigma factor [Mycobacteriales bacterium]|nr:sigma-70 family RNA polymerase sigma factor [Mycobacteriales bacterium]
MPQSDMSAEGDSRPAGPPASAAHDRLAGLLDAARAGERSSLEQIVVQLSPLLWQVARAQGLSHESAEDVVQTTWLSLLKHLADIRTPAALTAWLVTVTKRESWRVVRASRGERAMDDWSAAAVPDPDPPLDERLMADDMRRALWAAVRQLPQRCQQLLRIVAFTHRPDYAEVSAALGMPQGSIGPTRGRCLAKLRQLLTADPTWSTP